MSNILIDKIVSYLEALYPIIYINYFDFNLADKLISNAITAVSQKSKIVEYNNAYGIIDFDTKNPIFECDLLNFLKITSDYGYEQEIFLILKDIHAQLNDPEIISLLKRISETNLYQKDYYCSIIIVSDILVIPHELENYITIFEIPSPDDQQIIYLINNFKQELNLEISDDVISDFSLLFKGLHEFHIRQILNLAYQDGGMINKEDKDLILKEKEQFIKKSGLLEIVNTTNNIKNIGGLENLISWLKQKGKIFSSLDKALKFGVDTPKGIMIIGMPGCGKSLTAKATASLFEIPLIRLDVGRLLGKYVGESEGNMQRALSISQAISPCVLWVDEIEKAFAGVGQGGSGHEVTIRLFGQFLTWMQEKSNTVFVVGTANDITSIPPEFLRKGRFDEIFFVDLPNEEERLKILEIHIKKRNKWNRGIDLIQLIKPTEGFNGADLEAVVKDTVETAFINGFNSITTTNLLDIIKITKSISSTLKSKIDNISNVKNNFGFKLASFPSQK
ncbi:MAG: AAA family ATPase [Deltaproteobacteria bacterium]|jgi:AAA+ superfamily predicted ATPase|nr:AAA family ATPase [Deltaproteobacteria bacterium]